MLGPRWLKGHNYAVVIDGEFSACFSTISQAEECAKWRSIFRPSGDARRRAPLPFVVIDRRYGIAVASSGRIEDEQRMVG